MGEVVRAESRYKGEEGMNRIRMQDVRDTRINKKLLKRRKYFFGGKKYVQCAAHALITR